MRALSPLFSQRRFFARAAATLALLVCTAPGFAAPDWDFVGIRIGMTEAEVKAAFEAYDPKGKIIEHKSNFNYSDKVETFRTEPFLDQLELRVTGLSIHTPLRVWFSGPVGEVRVIGVARQESNMPNPVTAAQFTQNLVEKYGPPTEQVQKLLVWEAPGEPSCIRRSYGIDLQEFPQVATGFKKLDQAVAMLHAWQERPEPALPADLTTCGTFMYYTASMDPLKSFHAGLFDVGAIMATFESRYTWVEQLEAEAIRKREGQGQAPKL